MSWSMNTGRILTDCNLRLIVLRDGCGIISHEDGPTYAPQVATITLAGSALLNYISKSTSEQVDLYLPRR